MELYSVIKDECGTTVRICSNYTDNENEAFLETHPEYYTSTETVHNEYLFY